MARLKCKNCGYIIEVCGAIEFAECGDCGYTNEYNMYLPKEDTSGLIFDEMEDLD